MEQAPANAKTQRGRILRLLIEARGAWVPLPEIMVCAARIFELRKNFNIENRTETIDGQRHSWFRLIPSDAPKSAQSAPKPLKTWEQVCAERDRKLSQPEPEWSLTP